MQGHTLTVFATFGAVTVEVVVVDLVFELLKIVSHKSGFFKKVTDIMFGFKKHILISKLRIVN